jgi:hypothetical protein
MRTVHQFCVAALLLAASAAEAAPIRYDFNLSGGGATLTGQVTTDGSLGVITGSNLTDWAFNLAGPFTLAISSAAGNFLQEFAGLPVFEATATELFVMAHSPTGGDNQQLFFRPAAATSCGAPVLSFNRLGGAGGFSSVGFASDPCVGGSIFGEITRTGGALLVATAQPLVSGVPEPASVALALLALSAAGVATRARRR